MSEKVAAPVLSVPGTVPKEPFRSAPMASTRLSPIMPSGSRKVSKAPVSSAPWMMPLPPWSR